MALGDRSRLFDFVRPDGRTFFDFQIAAVDFCCERLLQGNSAVLALDTGLGKTCTVRAIVERMGARALLVCPGGLVRQTTASMARYPWDARSSSGWRVAGIETGNELTALDASTQEHRVVVLNRSLGLRYSLVRHFDLVVIDEAHQSKSCGLARSVLQTPILFVTACPFEGMDLMEAMSRNMQRSLSLLQKFVADCFIVEKTPRALKAVGAAEPRVVVLNLQLTDEELAAYDERLLTEVRIGCMLPSRLQIALSLSRLFPRLAPKAARLAHEVVMTMRSADVPLPRGEALSRLRGLFAEHGLSFPAAQYTPDSEGLAPDRHLRCGCCGLTPAEYSVLYNMHSKALPSSAPPWSLREARRNFTAAIVRYQDKRQIESVMKSHPPPKDILPFVLTSDRGAAYRARLVQRFSSHDGQRCKILVLARAFRSGNAPELLLRVGALGMGRMLLRALERFLARQRVLIADKAVDVGFDLHRHLNEVHVPRLVATRAELRQLTGRVSRIAVDQSDPGTIDVLANCYERTLDTALVLKHLRLETAASEDEERWPIHRVREVSARVRATLRGDTEALELLDDLIANRK